MGATDIDSSSLNYATTNIDLNDLSKRIRLVHTKAGDKLISPGLDAVGGHADFTMCNPPFYSSATDMRSSLSGEGKSKPPSAVCTGAESEMVTEGGDAGFVLRMVEESKELKEKVQWFTSMFGKLESARTVLAKLEEVGVTNWAVTCLRAGRKTRRWAVGWSWGTLRPATVSQTVREHDSAPAETGRTLQEEMVCQRTSIHHVRNSTWELSLKTNKQPSKFSTPTCRTYS